MSKRTNINIEYDNHKFNYLVECLDSEHTSNFSYENLDKSASFFNGNCIKHLNSWILSEDIGEHRINIKTSKLRLYFSDYSLEKYVRGGLYIIEAKTYIANKVIHLGSFLINRFDSLAVGYNIRYLNQDYNEYVEVSIPNPYDIIYGDGATEFRKNLKSNTDYNDDCSNLIITLQPVKELDGKYVIKDGCSNGQNSIIISNDIDDYLWTELKYGGNNKFDIIYHYNHSYNDINDYIYNTYKLKDVNIAHDVRLISPDNGATEKEEIYNNSFIINDLKLFENLNNWDAYIEGLSLVCFTNIYNVHNELVFSISSNIVPITPDMISKLIMSESVNDKILNYLIDNMINIEIVNEIIEEVKSSQINTHSGNNRTIPVFYKVKDLGNLIIHPEVIENVCINLDIFKPKVDKFILQIEGIKFNECGRTNSGVIFKVIGEKLPRITSSGTYYILNQNNELVTTGKYTYEL